MVTLAEEVPFVAAVHNDHLNRVCSGCMTSRTDEAFSRCSRCRIIYYCGKECQKNDWDDHKHECKLLREYPEQFADHGNRLVARLAFKLKRPEAQEAAFNGRTYEDLEDHYNEVDQTVPADEGNYMVRWIGQKFVADREALVSLTGKIAVNAFSITEDQFVIGSALYIGLSAHKHSCNPDAYIIYDGKKATLRSQNKDQKYSKDLTVTYVDLMKTTPDRKELLRTVFYTTCNCSLCQDETKDFLKNSIISTCCPGSYCLLDPKATKLSCFKCGKPSEISVREAISANNGIRDIDEGNYSAAIYEQYKKILSPLNVNLAQVACALFAGNIFIGNLLECRKYCDFLQKIYREYLAVGNPFLTAMLRGVATIMTVTDRPSKAILDLYEETLDITIRSCGADHPHTEACASFLDEYRIRCQREGII